MVVEPAGAAARPVGRADASPAEPEWLALAPPVFSLDVTMVATEGVELPGWLGSTLHGALGHALRDLTCSPRCLDLHGTEPHRCPYARLFEKPWPPRGLSPHVRAMTPPALWLRPPPPGPAGSLAPGACLRFGLVAPLARADDCGFLVAALERAARRGLGRGRGSLRLEEVSSGGHVIWRDGQRLGRPKAERVEPVSGPITIRARTPLRIIRRGLIGAPTFPDLVLAAARRVVAAAAFFGRREPDVDIKGLEAMAQEGRACVRREWDCFRVTRYSSSQKKRHPMEGYVGEMSIDDVDSFGTLLAAAQPFGVGKATAFGFGAYDLMCGATDLSPSAQTSP